MLISLHNRKYTHPTPGPARAHRQYLYLLVVVLFDLEMLGLVHFEKKMLLQFVSGCQIVCFYIDGVKLYWCQIGTGVKLSLLHSWCQTVLFTLLVSN